MSEIADYRTEVVEKLEKTHTEIHDLITTTLLKNESSAEGKVFYHKMDGDYARYLAEMQVWLALNGHWWHFVHDFK